MVNTKVDDIGRVCYVCNKGHIQPYARLFIENKTTRVEDSDSRYFECDNPECKTQFKRNRYGDFYPI